MDLKKRLASLDRMTRKTMVPPPDPKRIPTQKLACEVLGLTPEETPGGTIYLRHYADPIPEPDNCLPDLYGFLSQPGPDTLGAGDVLFLDTETTGLAGGTGTIAFLVGASWWESGRFHTRQYFLCGPGQESAMLKDLHLLAERFKAVATYNGASFDLPLLRTRALLNRLEHPWDKMFSWDLLVPSRRLWSRRLENCRQQTVEAEFCALHRDARVFPGALSPQTWFDFLQQGKCEDLRRVLYHNQRDMVGMAHIFRKMVAMAQIMMDEQSRPVPGWLDAWALGRIAEIRGDGPLSLFWFNLARLAAAPVPGAFADSRFVADAVRVLKRSGDWQVVENLIACALDCGQNEPWLHREAAILYEHRLVDLARAHRHALAAGDEHRLNRLVRKLKQQNDLE